MQIVIDEQFRKLLDPPEAVERSFLEQSLLEEGCRDKLVVWKSQNILIDGHNRYEICTAHKIPFGVHEIDLDSREDALDWVKKNQIGKRNCSPEKKKIYIGQIYNRRKRQGERKDLTSGQVDQKFDATADEVASELGVSPKTVRRNGQRAEVHDAMLEAGDAEAAEAAKKVPQSVIAEAKKEPERAAEVLKKPHVSNNSGEQDWYTPPEFLEAARSVLGEIDLDPASSDKAQEFVKASTYFTKECDGLQQDWRGRVWLNPPYASGIVEQFASKLVDSLGAGVCQSAIVLVNNATETRWFQLLANHASGFCFPAGRIKFLDATGLPKNSPLQGQVFLYFGDSLDSFSEQFARFGCVTHTSERVC